MPASTRQLPPPTLIPLEAIRARLFRDAANAARIRRDYALPQELCGADLEHALLSSFGQQQRDVTASRPDQKEVFEAAVRALGSNSRTWAAFLRGERAIRKALAGYDPTVAAGASPCELNGELRRALSGQTAGKDARAILDWAFLLTEIEDYGGVLTWQHRIARVRERCRDLWGREGWRWRVVRTSNALPTAGRRLAGYACLCPDSNGRRLRRSGLILLDIRFS